MLVTKESRQNEALKHTVKHFDIIEYKKNITLHHAPLKLSEVDDLR